MHEHVNKLVTRFFESVLGSEHLLIDSVDGTTGSITYAQPLRLRCGLRVVVDEADRRSFFKRATHYGYVINQPQELLKEKTRGWLEERIGKKIDLKKLSYSLKRKINRYQRHYLRGSSKRGRKKHFKDAVKESRTIQAREKALAEHRKKMRAMNSRGI